MKLLTLVLLTFQVVLVKSLGDVSGYLGDTITLKSGVNPAWTVYKIEWSIWSNHTWIATHRKNKTNTERVHQFGRRLRLDISSGDLTIQNLTRDDAMEYTVDVNTDDGEKVNKINLIVKEHLWKPTIQTANGPSVNGECLMVLDCSSPDNGVSHSWDVVPSSVYTTNRKSPHLSAIVNITQNSVNFNCTTTNNIDHAWSVVTLKCEDDKIQPPTSEPGKFQPRQRTALAFLFGLLLGVFIATIIHCFRDQIKNAFQSLRENVCS